MTDSKIATGLIALMILCSLYVRAQPEIETGAPSVAIDLFASSDSNCFRIPALVTAPNGDLLLAVDERQPDCKDLKWSKDINIVMRRSNDGGRSWSAIKTIVDYPYGQSASDPSFIVNEVTGEIFLFYNYMNLSTEQHVYYLHVIKSSDNGRSWSDPQDITPQIALPEWHNDMKFITSGHGIQTQSGKMLHTLVNIERGLFVFGSDDHGSSWQVIDTPIQPADESKIVELSGGHWMVNSRVNKLGMRYSHVSADQGKTWISQAETSLPDPGCNASVIRYKGAQNEKPGSYLIFSNANSPDRRENLSIRLSMDEGKTWSAGKTIYPGSAAYSDLTVLNDGDIGLVYEKDNYGKIAYVRFSLEWILDD